MRNPKIAMICSFTAKSLSYDVASISEILGQYSDNENVSGDAVL